METEIPRRARALVRLERGTGKRKYTMSEAALAQRRANIPAAAAAATGPITPQGKANSSRGRWIHGRYSAINRAQFGLGATSIAKMFGKPCLTTCPYHPDNAQRVEAPCSLVLDGLTHAGGSCLDKTVYVHALDALMSALTDGEMDGMQGLLAAQMASNLQLLDQIRNEIAENGLSVAVPMVSKDGQPVINPETGRPFIAEIKSNPILGHLIKFNESLGINFGELMVSPKSVANQRTEETAADNFQTALGAIFARTQKRLPTKTVTDAEADE